MKKILLLALLLSPQLFADDTALLEDKCGSCHATSSHTIGKISEMKAPPMWGMMKMVNKRYSNHEEAKDYIRGFVFEPHEKNMIFPHASIERFGLMPSQKGKITTEELERVLKVLYP